MLIVVAVHLQWILKWFCYLDHFKNAWLIDWWQVLWFHKIHHDRTLCTTYIGRERSMRSLLTSDVEHLQFIMPRPTVLCCDPSVCLFVCFMPLSQKRCILGLWLLLNTSRKPHARRRTHWSAWPTWSPELAETISDANFTSILPTEILAPKRIKDISV